MVARKESQQAIERRLVRALKHLTAEELAELYLVDDWDLHGATLSAFQQRAGDALEQGIRLAESADPETRDAACWLIAVGGKTSSAADQTLARLVDDPHPRVAQAAVGGLNILQVGRSHAIGARMQARPHEATFPWPEPLPAVVDLAVLAKAARHSEAGVRMMVAMSLWMCGEAEATGILVELARDDDQDVREAALRSMGWKRYAGGLTPQIVDILWTASREPARETRAHAIRSLVELEQPGSKDAFERELREAVDDGVSSFAIYPMVSLLYTELSAFLSSELREEACRRWAKGLVGKGVPRPRSDT